MSGIDLPGRAIRKGAGSAVTKWVHSTGGATVPPELDALVERVSASRRHAAGGRRAVRRASRRSCSVSSTSRTSSRTGIRERFDELRAMGIRTVMITGDNAITARAIAEEAGVDDVLAEATPEDKMALISKEQEGGRMVAMCGDGTNDAPALAQADVGVAMNTGTMAAKEAGNMVDLDSDPTKLIDVVEIGKQLLITRGRADDVLDRQRHREVLRDPPGDVRGRVPRARRPQRHAALEPRVGDRLGGRLQRADHRGADPARAPGRRATGRRRPRTCCAATCSSTASAAWSPRSSGIKLLDLVISLIPGL